MNLEPAVRAAIWDAAAPLREAVNGMRWTPADRLHLTARFLGEQDPRAADAAARAAAAVAARHRPPDLTLTGFGAFPNARRPRVVWMGVTDAPRLELIAHDLEETLAAEGFEPEGRPFRPHLTLARVREEHERPVARALARAGAAVDFEETVTIPALDLMESTPGPGGSRYRIVSSHLFADAARDRLR